MGRMRSWVCKGREFSKESLESNLRGIIGNSDITSEDTAQAGIKAGALKIYKPSVV